MAEQPKISVILPVHRAERYLRRCIDGLLSQDCGFDFEILMVNNNCPDQSAKIISEYPSIRLLSETKQGAYAARNKGIRAAVGEILVFTDPDCVHRVDWLSQIEATMRDPAIGILIGPSLSYSSSPGLRHLDAYERQKESYILSSDDSTLYWGRTSNMAVRTEVMGRFGPFQEQFRGSDVVFVRTVVNAVSCDAVRYAPEIGVKHLELSSIGVYLSKVFIYGRSRVHYNRIIRSRPLSMAERLEVYRRTINAEQYSYFDSALLFALLILGVTYWYAGAAMAWKKEDSA
jgi:glycosyltransferase involved in cell wall biosynthesis